MIFVIIINCFRIKYRRVFYFDVCGSWWDTDKKYKNIYLNEIGNTVWNILGQWNKSNHSTLSSTLALCIQVKHVKTETEPRQLHTTAQKNSDKGLFLIL